MKEEFTMILTTPRLTLRPWTESDAEALYEYASDPAVGPAAGWNPHESVDASLDVIRSVFCGQECYAICERDSDRPIGAIELMPGGATMTTDCKDECELGYWLGKPFWGRGYMPEAVEELLRRGFEELHLRGVWCAYYEGNAKSKRVQEKLGFVYHHTAEHVFVEMMEEYRTEIFNYMSKAQWEEHTARSK